MTFSIVPNGGGLIGGHKFVDVPQNKLFKASVVQSKAIQQIDRVPLSRQESGNRIALTFGD